MSECPRGSGGTSSCRVSGEEEATRSLSALGEEVRALREENNSLQHALALAQHAAATHRTKLAALAQERDILCKKVGQIYYSKI